jgi:hypothetical protein
MARRKLQWVTTTGGPHLVLPRPNLRDWSGINPSADPLNDARFRWNSEPGAPASDYDRACDVRGQLAVLDIGDTHAIALADAPDATLWWRLSADSGYFVRCRFCDKDDAVRAALEDVPERLFKRGQARFAFERGPLILFDSSVPGREFRTLAGVSGHQRIDLPPGTYTIETAEYEPDRETSLLLHRLRPAITSRRRRNRGAGT